VNAILADDVAAMEQCWTPDLMSVILATEYKDTCLMFACRLGSIKAVKWLVRTRSVNVEQAKSNGATSLLIAAQQGKVEVVTFFCGRQTQMWTWHPLMERHLSSSLLKMDIWR
jgi:ankyrin repeat protein